MNLKDIQLNDEQGEALVAMRGGCSCHLSPPCSNHVDPLTMEEADELGLLDQEPEKTAVAPVDHMKVTRDLCG